jgi:pimeloyl-ACP methyl ester carboxylesterase
MKSVFDQLCDDALSEVTRRDADYLSMFPVRLPAASNLATSSGDRAAGKVPKAPVLERISARASEYLAGQGVHLDQPSAERDPLGALLLLSAVDAYACETGDLTLAPRAESVTDPIAWDYDIRVTAGGRRYLVRRRGTWPLLVVSALGIPLTVWSRLLSDSDHDFKVIVPETRCSDLFCGGMNSDVSLEQHADDFAEVVLDLDVEDINILGWCNGGRIAIDLAAKQRQRVRSLILLSTTLRGVKGITAEPSAFEENLQRLFVKILKNNSLAVMMTKTLPFLVARPDWKALNGDASARARALLRRPAREHAGFPLLPMSSPQFFINYARRTALDEAYSIDQSLTSLAETRLPILLITGDYDDIVSNQCTLAALDTWVGAFVHAEIAGAGHFAQDLQYSYFVWALLNFVRIGQVPDAACRVRVRRHGPREAS